MEHPAFLPEGSLSRRVFYGTPRRLNSVQKGLEKAGTALTALQPRWDRNPDQIYDFNSAQTRHFLRRHCGS